MLRYAFISTSHSLGQFTLVESVGNNFDMQFIGTVEETNSTIIITRSAVAFFKDGVGNCRFPIIRYDGKTPANINKAQKAIVKFLWSTLIRSVLNPLLI
jgi:hypothetical protein